MSPPYLQCILLYCFLFLNLKCVFVWDNVFSITVASTLTNPLCTNGLPISVKSVPPTSKTCVVKILDLEDFNNLVPKQTTKCTRPLSLFTYFVAQFTTFFKMTNEHRRNKKLDASAAGLIHDLLPADSSTLLWCTVAILGHIRLFF